MINKILKFIQQIFCKHDYNIGISTVNQHGFIIRGVKCNKCKKVKLLKIMGLDD